MATRRLDHKMILRLMFVMILLAMVTGTLKSWALKRNAHLTTPKLAKKYFDVLFSYVGEELPQASALSGELSMVKDGWGNPFYWDSHKRFLRSAGLDEIMGTSDDFIFLGFTRGCNKVLQKWVIGQLRQGGYKLDKLPQGYIWNSNLFAVERDKQICYLPDLSGEDGLYQTHDDLILGLTEVVED